MIKRFNLIAFVALLIFVLMGREVLASISDIQTAVIKENYVDVQRLAKEFLKENPENVEVQYYLALSYLRFNQYKPARDILSDLVKQDNNIMIRDKAYLGLFDCFYLQENYKKAGKTISKMLKISPDSEFASLMYLKAARVNLRLANWDKARSYLKRIVRDYPDSFEDYIARQLLDEKQYFAVQVGAFVERKRAEKLVEELALNGEYSYIVETTDRQNRKFYRVRVGQNALLSEAQSLELRLSDLGYPTQIYP